MTSNIDEYIISVLFDDETQRWYAQNDEIPIVLEDESLDTLIKRIKLAAPEMMEINNIQCEKIKLTFKIEALAVVA